MRKLKQAAALCTALLMCSQTVFGASLRAGALFDADTNKLSITGTGEKNGEVTVVITPYHIEETQLTQDSAADNAVFYMAYTDDEGRLDAAMGLKTSWNGGSYKADVTQDGERMQLWFTYADKNEMEAVLPKVNRGTASEITTVLQSDGEALGADAELVKKYGAVIGKYLYANRPGAGYDPMGFLTAYTAGLALSMVKSGDASLETVAERFSRYMEIDIEEDYNAYTKAVKQELERLIQADPADQSSVGEIYRKNLLLARVNKAESDTALQTLVLENKDVLGLNMTVYRSLGSDYKELQVFTKMRSGTYASYDEVRNAFARACAEVQSGAASQGGGVGSSGGGGGGSLGGGSYTNIPGDTSEPENPGTERFSDMRSHWAKEIVYALADLGVINGYPDGTFLPETKVTRAEFSKMICTALNLEAAVYQEAYRDVRQNDWFAPYVLSLSEKGIVTGYDGSFNPDAFISRQDAAVIAWRALEYQGRTAEARGSFDDFEEISGYAKEAVAKLAGLHVINGYEGRFAPMDNTTRAEAAAILRNVMDVLDLE